MKSIGRRGALGALATAPVALAAAPAIAAEEDLHVAWGAEQRALYAYVMGPARRDDPRPLSDTPWGARLFELEELILDTAAATPEGLLEQARIMAGYLLDGSYGDSLEERGMRSLYTGLDALCARRAAA